MKIIESLTKKQFDDLKAIDMLYEFYPDAPEKYDDINTLNIIENPDFTNLTKIVKEYVDGAIVNGYEYEETFDSDLYHMILKTYYGEDAFDILEEINDNI